MIQMSSDLASGAAWKQAAASEGTPDLADRLVDNARRYGWASGRRTVAVYDRDTDLYSVWTGLPGRGDLVYRKGHEDPFEFSHAEKKGAVLRRGGMPLLVDYAELRKAPAGQAVTA